MNVYVFCHTNWWLLSLLIYETGCHGGLEEPPYGHVDAGCKVLDLDTRPPSFLRCLFMVEIGCFRYPSFLPLHCSSSHATRRRSGRGPRFTDKTSLLHLPRQVFQALGTLTTGRFLHWVIWWRLILVHRNLNMSLFNPFSRQRFPFPPVSSFPQLGTTMVVRRSCMPTAAALSSCVTANLTDPQDLIVMVAHGWAGKLAFTKPGESSWQMVDKGDNLFPESIAFYEGKFYTVGQRGTGVVCTMGLNPKVEQLVPATKPPKTLPRKLSCGKRYLVESLGELMMVERWLEWYHDDANDEEQMVVKTSSN